MYGTQGGTSRVANLQLNAPLSSLGRCGTSLPSRTGAWRSSITSSGAKEVSTRKSRTPSGWDDLLIYSFFSNIWEKNSIKSSIECFLFQRWILFGRLTITMNLDLVCTFQVWNFILLFQHLFLISNTRRMPSDGGTKYLRGSWRGCPVRRRPGQP